MRITFIVILNLFIISILSQEYKNDSITTEYIGKLSFSGVDTILIYERSCVGCEFIVIEENDSCYNLVGEPWFIYLFWRKNGQDFISKVSNYPCYDYDTIKTNLNAIWNMYVTNKLKIRNEPILIPSYLEKGDTVNVDIDHYSYAHIRVLFGKESIDFEISDYYLSQFVYDNIKNINYSANSETMRKKLMDEVEKEIKLIEDNNQIKKIKRFTTACITNCCMCQCERIKFRFQRIRLALAN
jgi:hypothetical protein